MNISQLNFNLVLIFDAVYRTRNMTKAASELSLTPSGVSQHIKKLEEGLGTSLFIRHKKELLPTRQGQNLYIEWKGAISKVQKGITLTQEHDGPLRGIIRVGFPSEFGNNVVLPLLSDFALKYPYVDFKFYYGFATKITDKLKSGELDLAFVDDIPIDCDVVISDGIYKEELHLCCSKKYFNKSIRSFDINKEFYQQLDYHDYVDQAAILGKWFRYHYKYKNFQINIRSTLMSVKGMLILLLKDFGVGVLPSHIIDLHRKELYLFDGRKTPLINEIKLIYPQQSKMISPAKECIDYIKKHM